MVEESKNETSMVMTDPPAIRCSYCEKTYEDKEKFDMGLESSDWAICFKCSKKAMNKVSKGIGE